MRMTRLSRENLMVADAVQLHCIDNYVIVSVSRNGSVSYLQSSNGPVRYASLITARRAVRRLRPDLEPTEI